jgi:hypothetical protein
MEQVEIENLIDQKVDTAVSRQFGMIMEWFTDQFALVYEGQQNIIEVMERRFQKVEDRLDRIEINTNRNTLDIHALQEKDKESWRRYKKY